MHCASGRAHAAHISSDTVPARLSFALLMRARGCLDTMPHYCIAITRMWRIEARSWDELDVIVVADRRRPSLHDNVLMDTTYEPHKINVAIQAGSVTHEYPPAVSGLSPTLPRVCERWQGSPLSSPHSCVAYEPFSAGFSA